MDPINHAALQPGRVAVITGGASGIGLASARRIARAGMKVCIADLSDELESAAATIAEAGAPEVMTRQIDVSDAAALIRLREDVLARFGDVALLMNNAATGGGGHPWSNPDAWSRTLGVNLMGVVNGVQAFTQAMIDLGRPAAIVNTGSKQGITSPPGDIAYNVSKAGIKTLTEGLAHGLRSEAGCQVSAHLLIPGFTYTGMMVRRLPEKPAAAWEPSQVADAMVAGIEAGDFYILCPDNETPRELDERRVLWAAGDLVENRPALSRWHPDYKNAFEAFVRGD